MTSRFTTRSGIALLVKPSGKVPPEVAEFKVGVPHSSKSAMLSTWGTNKNFLGRGRAAPKAANLVALQRRQEQLADAQQVAQLKVQNSQLQAHLAASQRALATTKHEGTMSTAILAITYLTMFQGLAECHASSQDTISALSSHVYHLRTELADALDSSEVWRASSDSYSDDLAVTNDQLHAAQDANAALDGTLTALRSENKDLRDVLGDVQDELVAAKAAIVQLEAELWLVSACNTEAEEELRLRTFQRDHAGMALDLTRLELGQEKREVEGLQAQLVEVQAAREQERREWEGRVEEAEGREAASQMTVAAYKECLRIVERERDTAVAAAAASQRETAAAVAAAAASRAELVAARSQARAQQRQLLQQRRVFKAKARQHRHMLARSCGDVAYLARQCDMQQQQMLKMRDGAAHLTSFLKDELALNLGDDATELEQQNTAMLIHTYKYWAKGVNEVAGDSPRSNSTPTNSATPMPLKSAPTSPCPAVPTTPATISSATPVCAPTAPAAPTTPAVTSTTPAALSSTPAATHTTPANRYLPQLSVQLPGSFPLLPSSRPMHPCDMRSFSCGGAVVACPTLPSAGSCMEVVVVTASVAGLGTWDSRRKTVEV